MLPRAQLARTERDVWGTGAAGRGLPASPGGLGTAEGIGNSKGDGHERAPTAALAPNSSSLSLRSPPCAPAQPGGPGPWPGAGGGRTEGVMPGGQLWLSWGGYLLQIGGEGGVTTEGRLWPGWSLYPAGGLLQYWGVSAPGGILQSWGGLLPGGQDGRIGAGVLLSTGAIADGGGVKGGGEGSGLWKLLRGAVAT